MRRQSKTSCDEHETEVTNKDMALVSVCMNTVHEFSAKAESECKSAHSFHVPLTWDDLQVAVVAGRVRPKAAGSCVCNDRGNNDNIINNNMYIC